MTGAGTVDTGGNDVSFSGKITGTGGALTKAGAGILTLSSSTSDFYPWRSSVPERSALSAAETVRSAGPLTINAAGEDIAVGSVSPPH